MEQRNADVANCEAITRNCPTNARKQDTGQSRVTVAEPYRNLLHGFHERFHGTEQRTLASR